MNVEKKDAKIPVVYIASPYAGDIESNVALAKQYCRYAADKGCAPIAPHLYLPGFLSEETERDKALRIGLQLLEACDELWICGDTVSSGMLRELKRGLSIGLPVKFIPEDDGSF